MVSYDVDSSVRVVRGRWRCEQERSRGARQVQRLSDDVRDPARGSIVALLCELGGSAGRRGAQTQKRRLAPVSNANKVRCELAAADNGDAAAELAARALGAPSLHHACHVRHSCSFAYL